MNAFKVFNGLLLLILLFGHSTANPRPDDDDAESVNTADSDESAEPKCISPGDFFYPVNLVTENDFLNSDDSKSSEQNVKSSNDQKEKNSNDQNEKNKNEQEEKNSKDQNDKNKNDQKDKNKNDKKGDDNDEEPDDSDGTRFETGQTSKNNTDEVWRRLSVNRYYGVFRDRFFVRNIEGLIHIQLRDGDPWSKATILGIDDDWREEYVFARANIFYSQSKEYGAMHSIWGVTFALEIQFVHYKKTFPSLEEASKVKHGVLVICIMFESSGKETTYMDPIVAAAIMSIFPSDKFHVAHGPLDLKALFPNDMTNLQYTGDSLVPPCAREAKFLVLLSPRMVAEKQLSKFREVRDHEGKKKIGVFGKGKGKREEGIKCIISANIRLSVEDYEVLTGASLKASVLLILFLCFGTFSSNF